MKIKINTTFTREDKKMGCGTTAHNNAGTESWAEAGIVKTWTPWWTDFGH